MQLTNSADRYGLITKLLHWLIALLIVSLIVLGWYMVDLTYYDRWYNASLTAHKALGLLVLLLAAIKIIWTLINRSPPMVVTLKRWERIAAHVAHGLLYLVMVLIPVTGYIVSTSAGDGISMFGWFDVPALFAAGPESRDLAITVHFYLGYGTAGLVAVHTLAALKHHFVNYDATLSRML